jgi:hypothetical protein
LKPPEFETHFKIDLTVIAAYYIILIIMCFVKAGGRGLVKHLIIQNWKFILGNAPEAFNPPFPDSGWKDVTVPHDWSVSFPFSREHSSGTGYLPGGIGWYRARFSLEKTFENVVLEFDGVYKNAQIWVNGYYMGKRPYGYISFSFDISARARVGENVIAVKVTHPDISDSRWFTGSGIYRKVRLLLQDGPLIPKESVFFTFDGENAKVECPSPDAQAVLISPDGLELTFGVNENFKVPSPRLWSTGSPSLYSLRLLVGGAIASEEIKVGLRTIEFCPDEGFFLNGESMKIKGVNAHHDAGCLGAAAYPEIWRRRLLAFKDAGANAIRTSHNPAMPELYDLCDELGFLVMDEAFDEWEGPKNKWSTGHNVYPPKHQGYFEDFPEWGERDLADFVKRDRNHPSVVMWSVGNELDYPNDPYCSPLFKEMRGNNDANKPQAEMVYNEWKPDAKRLCSIAGRLANVVKELDKTRPVLFASAYPELSSRIGMFDCFDIIGYNYKEQLYAEDHKRFPHLPILGSENGHDYKNWLIVKNNPYISGQFLWTGADFLGEAHGWPIRGSQSGLLDTAGYKKPAFYRRKAMWSDSPQIFLAAGYGEPSRLWGLARSWNFAQNEIVNVFCFTNLSEAELFHNGQSLGKKGRDPALEHILWQVPFERGELTAAGAGASDSLATHQAASRVKAELWGKPAPYGELKFCQVEISVVDDEGLLASDSFHMLWISVEGGTLAGIENGDLADCQEYSANCRRAKNGRAIAYALAKEPGAKLRIEAEGLVSAVVELDA